MSYPSGDVVKLNYDARGTLLGESEVLAAGQAGVLYRNVTAMTERGQIAAQGFGNGLQETNTYDPSTGMALSMSASGLLEAPPAACAGHSAPDVKQIVYLYDQFLNLKSQVKGFYLRDPAGAIRYDGACQPVTASATERYDYDDLQRLTGASRMWDGMSWQPPTTPADTYAYDDLGNITSKSDYGDQYSYGSAARTNGLAGPHAVTSISMAGFPKASFQYDLNGNLTYSDGPDGRNITFDDYDRPTKVVMGGVTTLFRYAPDGSRYLQQTTTATGTRTVYYVGKEYQRVDWSSRPTEEQVYIGPSVVVYQSGSTRDSDGLHLEWGGRWASPFDPSHFQLTLGVREISSVSDTRAVSTSFREDEASICLAD
jgi:hypothetical protein